MPNMVMVKISISAAEGGPALVSRTLLRPQRYSVDPSDPGAGGRK